jgi:D-glycerate 3-kinase
MFLFKSVFITLLHLRLRDRPHPGWIWALLLTQIFLGLTFTVLFFRRENSLAALYVAILLNLFMLATLALFYDVYLPSSLRRLIAESVHPLFATRGPPGTHNVVQLNETIGELTAAGEGAQTVLPAFDKVTDNPTHASHRPVFHGKPSVILVDGWCLGATAQTDDELVSPVNVLEAERDKDAIWRKEVNANLAGAYQLSFDMLDAIVSLQAPSFAIIQEWRCEQEEGLLNRDLTDADRARVARFIQHFERITRHMMSGGRRADIEVQLDARRNVTEIKRS